uniref:CENP-V/GFA domain-containing protein n=1 Tax=Lotharella oceanica TaxID=641309 RepID=A0A7S2TG76_9EUKA
MADRGQDYKTTVKCDCGECEIVLYGKPVYPNGNYCCCNDCRQSAQYLEKQGGRKELKEPAKAVWYPNDIDVVKENFYAFKLRDKTITTKVACKKCHNLIFAQNDFYQGNVTCVYYKTVNVSPMPNEAKSCAVFCTSEFPPTYPKIKMPEGKIAFQCEKFFVDGKPTEGLMEFLMKAFSKKVENPKGSTNGCQIVEKLKSDVVVLNLEPLKDF